MAGISVTWYTFLEQGRDVNPSEQVLGAIAEALGLDDAERSYVLALSTDVPALQEGDDRSVAPEVADVLRMVEPNPAYVTGSAFELLAWNESAADLFRDATTAPDPNLVLWVFLAPAARDALCDWSGIAQGVLARFRTSAGRHPGSATLARVQSELLDASPEAREWWPRYDIGENRAGAKRVRRLSGQILLLSYASFRVADRPDQVLTIHRPIEAAGVPEGGRAGS